MGMTCLLPGGKPNDYKYHVEVYAWYPILRRVRFSVLDRIQRFGF